MEDQPSLTEPQLVDSSCTFLGEISGGIYCKLTLARRVPLGGEEGARDTGHKHLFRRKMHAHTRHVHRTYMHTQKGTTRSQGAYAVRCPSPVALTLYYVVFQPRITRVRQFVRVLL